MNKEISWTSRKPQTEGEKAIETDQHSSQLAFPRSPIIFFRLMAEIIQRERASLSEGKFFFERWNIGLLISINN